MQQKPVRLCAHCGNKAPFDIRAEYTHTVSVGDPPYTDEFYTTWTIVQCPSCFGVTITETKTSTFEQDPIEGWKAQVQVIYPTTRGRISNLPDLVQRAYEAAMRVRYMEPSAFAVLAGRTLEAVCKDQQAHGKTLDAKLKDLANQNRIPQVLAEMAQQVKEIRSLGAHADEADEVKSDDVPVILDFLEAILEYLYHAPAKVAAVKARLAKAT